jgi:hypothetical protein
MGTNGGSMVMDFRVQIQKKVISDLKRKNQFLNFVKRDVRIYIYVRIYL